MDPLVLTQATECVMHLQTSLESTSRHIQQSKSILASLFTPAHSFRSHHSITVRRTHTDLCLNINMSLSHIERENNHIQQPEIRHVNVNGKQFVREKPFGKIDLKDQIPKVQAGNEEETEDDTRQKVFSFGSNEEVEYDLESGEIRTLKKERDDAIKIVEGDDQDEVGDFIKRVVSEEEDNNTGTGEDRKMDVETERKTSWTHREYLDENICLQESTERFQNIKKRLTWTETKSTIEESMEHHSQQQWLTLGSQSAISRKVAASPKTPTHRSPAPPAPSFEKLQLLKYFSKSPSQKKVLAGSKCPRFQRQLQEDRRLKYITEAMKTPIVSRCFALSQLYDLYCTFRKSRLPEFRWIQFLLQKSRSRSFSTHNLHKYTSA